MHVSLSPAVACFGPFQLDAKAGELHRDGCAIRLQEQPLQLLRMLLDHPGQVVSREDMRRRLWPNDTIVEFDQSINAAIKKLRLALADSAENPLYVETVACRGYRLIVPVTWSANTASPPRQGQAVEEAQPHEGDRNLIGKKVSHYRVLQVIGGGGMGVVYAAEDLKLGRPVALKFLPEELATDPAAMGRFEREARAASALNHPNICTIYEVAEHAGQPFIVMELLEGQTLRELISAAASRPRGPDERGLPLETMIDVAVQTAEALDAAHRRGIIHRDIKPANIFVTRSGQTKIVDFGLAKLPASDAPDPQTVVVRESAGASDVALTRTGVPLGTAGYMSPEQVLGEKVDSRTDLFSLGLVLYEMATGQRAFGGETAAIVDSAILNNTPTPVQKLSPKRPAKLQEIIDKALQKHRELRYPTAAELAWDLRSLRQPVRPKTSGNWWKVAAGAVILLAIGVSRWPSRQLTTPFGLPPVRQRPLTVNSPENAVGSGAISPDGKRLVFSDAKGLHLESLDSGETQSLIIPDAIKYEDRQLGEAISWFHDGSRFLVNAKRRATATNLFGSQDSSVWIFSIRGEAPRKLRDNAYACAPSPDGSLIPFNTNKGRRGDREIWLMSSDGENARKWLGTDEDGLLNCGGWSPHGKRLLYAEADKSGARFLTRELQGGSSTVVLESAYQIPDVNWLSDGRLIFSKWEPTELGDGNCDFWELRLDETTGRALAKPRQLTSWSGFCMSDSSVTADNHKVAFLKWTSRFTTYLARLDRSGTAIESSKRFTLSETADQPLDWTPDGKALIFYSNRTGATAIYRQSVDEDSPHLLVRGNIVNEPRVTPDGKWLLYVPAPQKEETAGVRNLMRMPVNGGEPRLVAPVRSDVRIVCARPPSDLCAIAEPDENHRQLIITAVDAVKGRGAELTRCALDPNESGWSIDLSPDGRRLAALRNPGGSISVLFLGSGATSEIHVNRWTNLHSVHWAADGKGLFVGAGSVFGTLLHVDLAGHANVLWTHASPLLSTASPDGRYLAIADHTMERNMWMVENFDSP
jgi:serine/threonine protein kinase